MTQVHMRDIGLGRGARSYLVAILGALTVFLLERAVSDEYVRCALADFSWTAASIAAIVGTARAVRRAPEADRLSWACFLAGSVAWLLGQGARDMIEVGTIPVPHLWMDFAFLAAAPLWTIGLVFFLRTHGQRLALLALLLDTGAVVLTLISSVTLYLSSILPHDVAHDPGTSAVAVLYPLVYVAATGAALSVVWGIRADAQRSAPLALFVGLGLNAVAFTLYLPAYIQDGFAAGTIIDPLWVVGMSAIGIAGVSAADGRRTAAPAPLSWGVEFSRMVLPGVVAAASAFLLVYTDFVDIGAAADLIDAAVALTVLVLATRAGLALYANWVFGERERRRAEQLSVLYDVGLATARELSLDDLASLIAREATGLTGTDGAMVAIGAGGNGLVVRAQHNASALGLRLATGETLRGIALDAVRSKDLVVAADYRSHPDSNPLLHTTIASAIAAPLVAHGDVVGTRTAYARHRRACTPETCRLVRLYAAQAAVAIANAELLAETRRLARDDDLTGVLNRRSLLERLEAEIATAARHGDILAVVLSDVDGLKGVNDSAGHLVGNDVLRAAARAMRETARVDDVVARVGGDEFVLLLPRTGELPAQAVVGRIAARLRDEHYTWAGRTHPLPRASFGIAWFPEDGRDADSLLGVADVRMYEDKARARRTRETAAAEAD
jgi:diguanylate cyclase (GGDEF)-like protein